MLYNVGYLQNDPEFGNIKKNVDDVYKKLENTKDTLIVLPELFASGYNFNEMSEVRSLSTKTGEGYTFEALSHLSQKNNLHIVFGYPEKDKDKFFNSAALISKGRLIGNYRKIHLFYKEKEFFSSGDLGFKVFDIENSLKIGIMICFDWIFPESARTLMLMGANVICHCANLVLPFCPDAAITRSVENHVYYILANRIGTEARKETHSFIGMSEIISPTGELINRSPKDLEDIFTTKIDTSIADNKSLNHYNDIVIDRRPEYYL